MSAKTLLASAAVILCGLPLWAEGPAERYGVVRAVQGGAFAQNAASERDPQGLTVNLPIFEGDTAWTEASGRLGAVLPDGNSLWLDGGTRMEVDRLPSGTEEGGNSLQFRLWKGTALVEMRNWTPSLVSSAFSTPSASISPLRACTLIIEVETVDRTRVTCLDGACTVTTAGGGLTLESGQMTYGDYGYPPLRPLAAQRASYEPLLAFSNDSLPRRARGVSQRYLPENLQTYSGDFDTYGTWVYTNDYGYVWRPSVLEAEWSPYMNGRWWWGPWGMTWVPVETWGWAPFHYGRWTFVTGIGWGWIPLSIFSPAWVAWYWGDDGWLGWCPLGWDGYPYWSHCGWYSVGVGHLYDPHIHRVIVHHRTAPPPRPIYPRAQGVGGVALRGGGPRGGGAVVSPLNLSPDRVRDYDRGRTSWDDLKRDAEGPQRARDSRTEPAPGSAGTGRTGWGSSPPDPASGSAGGRRTRVAEPGRTAGDGAGGAISPRTREPVGTPGAGNSGTVSPRSRESVGSPTRGGRAGASGGSRSSRWTQQSGVPTRDGESPSASRERVRTPVSPPRGSSGRVEAPRSSERSESSRESASPKSGRSSGQPRYIPSRPSSGMDQPSPAPKSQSGGRRRH
jgi:hypothetical protein